MGSGPTPVPAAGSSAGVESAPGRATGRRRAAVLGSPVAHSLSPVLHGAAYAALGLDGWTYERVECDAEALPGWIAGRDDTWAGASVTMPGKRAALEVASTVSGRARRIGAANTLVRGSDGSWSADCTDVDGVAGALRAAGLWRPGTRGTGTADAVVLGSGATACAALGGLSEVGCELVSVVVRDPQRARGTLDVAAGLGLAHRALTWEDLRPDDTGRAMTLINTTPAGSVDAARSALLVEQLPATAVVLDAVYHPWPTPLAAAAARRGLAVATGLDMLLHQAFGQVEQFTGRAAPRAAMHAALVEATSFPVLTPS